MSLNIRYLTNGQEYVFTVANNGVDPPIFEVFADIEQIDHRIRHYAYSAVDRGTQFCFPGLARIFGVLDIFYPNYPNCIKEGFEDQGCIAEGCKHLECERYNKAWLNYGEEAEEFERRLDEYMRKQDGSA